jgi:hypothetical protein
MRIGWLVNVTIWERALSLRSVLHLPTTQCACADFGDFAKQRNGSGGGGGRERGLLDFLYFVDMVSIQTIQQLQGRVAVSVIGSI